MTDIFFRLTALAEWHRGSTCSISIAAQEHLGRLAPCHPSGSQHPPLTATTSLLVKPQSILMYRLSLTAHVPFPSGTNHYPYTGTAARTRAVGKFPESQIDFDLPCNSPQTHSIAVSTRDTFQRPINPRRKPVWHTSGDFDMALHGHSCQL